MGKGMLFARHGTAVIGLKTTNANQNVAFANDNAFAPVALAA